MGIKNIFIRKAVEKQVAKQVEKELGGKSLAYVSKVVRGLIPSFGVEIIRKRVISGIEGDLKRALKKNPKATVDELIHDAINTPEYIALLKDINMNEEHLKVMAKEAQEKYAR